MKAKEYLSGIRLLSREIRTIERELKDIETEQKRLDVYQDAKGAGAGKLKAAKKRYIEIYCDYVSLKEKYYVMVRDILEQIRAITPELYAEVLYMRYVQGLSFHVIAHEMNYANKYIINLHGKALQAFTEAWPDVLE